MTSHRDESSEGRSAGFRFVHCADVHLDAPHACNDDIVRARLDQEARTALGKLVELCLQQRVHALLVAGDLFDDQRLLSTAVPHFFDTQRGVFQLPGFTGQPTTLRNASSNTSRLRP